MIYLLSTEFTKISETTGTIQNTSHITTIELSPSNVKGSGIFIYPLQSKTFSNKEIYLRGVDGAAEARVIPFEVGEGGGDISLSDNAFQDVSLSNGTVAFLNGAGQVVKYFTADPSIAVSNNSISAAISSASGNLLSLKNDGLFAGDDNVTSVADWSAVLQQSFGFTSGS